MSKEITNNSIEFGVDENCEVKHFTETEEYKDWYERFLKDRKMFIIENGDNIIFPNVNYENSDFKKWVRAVARNDNFIAGFYYDYNVYLFDVNDTKRIPNINLYAYFKLRTLFNVYDIKLGYYEELNEDYNENDNKYINIKSVKTIAAY